MSRQKQNDGSSYHLLQQILKVGAAEDSLGRPPSIREATNVEAIGPNLYRGTDLWKPQMARGVFGGQVVSQALMAAVKSVEGSQFLVHSLHCYFLHPVQPQPEVIYDVEKIKDGKSFSSRSIKALQDGRVMFHCLASFNKEESRAGIEIDYMRYSMPNVPVPGSEVVPDSEFVLHNVRNAVVPAERYFCIPQRSIEDGKAGKPLEPRLMLWARCKEAPSTHDHQNLHRVSLAFISDFNMAWPMILKYPGFRPGLVTSLDHSIWFHTTVDSNKWHLMISQCDRAAEERTLNVGRIFSEDGTLVATCRQEGLMRQRL